MSCELKNPLEPRATLLPSLAVLAVCSLGIPGAISALAWGALFGGSILCQPDLMIPNFEAGQLDEKIVTVIGCGIGILSAVVAHAIAIPVLAGLLTGCAPGLAAPVADLMLSAAEIIAALAYTWLIHVKTSDSTTNAVFKLFLAVPIAALTAQQGLAAGVLAHITAAFMVINFAPVQQTLWNNFLWRIKMN